MNYGQFGEDLYIQSLFTEERKYYAIEVGAADGIAGSPTKGLEDLGWDILCIEANPSLYEQCKLIRKYSLNYAVGKENKDDVGFMVFNLRGGNQTAISSLFPDSRLIDQHDKMGILETQYLEIVNLRTLDYCIEEWESLYGSKLPTIDFISIDTEGTEMDVLAGFDILKWKPRLVAIENNFEDDIYRSTMINSGYNFVNRIGVNDYFLIK